MKAAVLHRQFVVRQPEIVFKPFQEGGFENSAPAIKRVAGQPDDFRSSKANVAGVIELRDEFFVREGVYGTAGSAVEQRELHARPGVMFPDKLQHQQLVKIGVEQRPGDRVEFPVVIVRPLREVHDHALISSYAFAAKANLVHSSEYFPQANRRSSPLSKNNARLSASRSIPARAVRESLPNGSISTSSFLF